MSEPVSRIDKIKWVDVSELKQHPKNRNKHPAHQIERLAELIEYQGWRYPIKVSNRSGFITTGHGRLMAAKLKGWKKVPVSFQEYDTEEQEYADVQADNAIALWSELDLSGINKDLSDLGPDFNIDMLGIENFTLDVPALEFGKSLKDQKAEYADSTLRQIIFVMEPAKFEEVVEKLNDLKEKLDLETNTDVFFYLLDKA